MKPRSSEFPGCADQRLYIFVCLTDGVSEEADDGGVACDSSGVLHHGRGAPRDGVPQFSTAIVAVHLSTQPIAIFEVRFRRQPDAMTFNRTAQHVPLHARQMFAHIVAKLCI